MKMTVIIPDPLWKAFEKKALTRFDRYGAIKKAAMEAIQEWIKK